MRAGTNAAFLLLILSACGEDPKPDDTDTTPPVETGPDTWAEFVDADGDGVTEADGDCDDGDPLVFPGNTEDCNGADDNCNDMIDEGFSDNDGDGTADCIDTEECDGIDNDGDGQVDEDFSDTDGDGVADCVQDETCDGLDNNGDGEVDEGFDADGDGYTTCGSDTTEPDCDDSDAEVNPGAVEVDDDLIDNDCDGMADEGAWAEGDLLITEIMVNPQSVADPLGEWFEVLNMSGETRYLNGLILVVGSGGQEHVVTSDELLVLEPDALFVFGNNGDFDTNGEVVIDYAYDGLTLGNESDDLSIHTPELEIDGRAWDDGSTMPDTAGASMSLDAQALELGLFEAENWCASQDGWDLRSDYGTPGEPNGLCPNFDHDGDGWSNADGDCDDYDATVFPGAEDFWYDGIDQDCDGWSDYDADADGFDSDLWGGDDCNDADAEVNPDATEVCDDLDIDEDCNGSADNDDSGATGKSTWYTDADGDGYGLDGTDVEYCDPPAATSSVDGDCDDTNPFAYEGATEVWYNGTDEDCDGGDDYDQDGDGYQLDFYGGDDCDDTDASVYPTDWYPDADGDGYGDETATATTVCGQPTGYVADNTDCDDTNAAIYLCQTAWTIAESATSSWSNSGYYRGNSYLADADDTLVSFEQYVYLSSSCTLDFYVHEQDSSGVWGIVWYAAVTADAATAFVSSGDIDLAVTAGHKYMLGIGYASCSVTSYGESGSWSGYDTGIGTFLNPHFTSSYTGYSSTFVPSSTGGSTTAYTQTVNMATEY